MRYIAVKWLHKNIRYPIELFSEIDEIGWEQRKVEIYADGKTDYATETVSTGSTRLGECPIPSLAEIAANPEFDPREITREEFEMIWKKATDS